MYSLFPLYIKKHEKMKRKLTKLKDKNSSLFLFSIYFLTANKCAKY